MNKHTTGSVLFGESPAIRWLMLIAMIVNASFLVSGTAFAETIWTPSVSLAAMHDDNILFTSTDTVDDYIYSAQPQIRFDYRQELTRLAADGNVIIRRYQDNSIYDDEIYNFGLTGDTNASERFRLAGSYKFIKDTTLDSELLEVGRVFARDDRYSHDVRLAPTFNFTERMSIGLEGRYRNVAYDSNAFVDYSAWELNLPVRWRMATQVDTIYISPGYANRDSDINRSNSYNLRLGWDHESTERLNLKLSIGAGYTELEQVSTGQTENNWNGLGNLQLNYKFETGHLAIDFQHDLQNTAIGDQVTVSRVIARLQKNLTERFGMEVSGRYYNTKTDGENNNYDTEYEQAGFGFFYNLTENHVFFINYEYSQEYRKNVADEPRANRNAVWAGIRLSFPM